VGNSLLDVIFLLFFYPAMASRIESSMGSGQFLILQIIITLGTNFIFSAVCLLLSVSGMRDALLWNCSGYWLLAFGVIVIDCMQV
jgi:hypothetical protein